MRFLLGLIILISFDFKADERDGLPELATEEQKRELQARRSKVLTASTARRVQKIVEGLDEAGQLEEAKTLLLKDKKTAEANLKDKQIDAVIKETDAELAQLRNRVSSLNSYDRSMFYYYQAYINLAYKDNLVGARNDYLNLIKEKDAQPRIKLSSYYTVAQLYLSDEDFDNGIKYLKLWFKTTDEVTAQAYVLLGQAYFLQDQFQKAYNVMMEAKRISDETGTTFRENWFSILLATMGELT